nr:MAG TPA: hypothetical protein [Caudoviricetes sp.]
MKYIYIIKFQKITLLLSRLYNSKTNYIISCLSSTIN